MAWEDDLHDSLRCQVANLKNRNQSLVDEIVRLRAALERIVDTEPDDSPGWFHDVANEALREGD